jgi:H+/Cl- antiporter ClcA
LSGSIGGLIAGLITSSSFHVSSFDDLFLPIALAIALYAGLSVGTIGGLGVASLNDIALVETIGWNWNQFWKRMILGSIVGLIGGLIFTLIWSQISKDTPLLGNTMSLALICGLISGLIGGFTARIKADKVSPNQGINLSCKNFFAVFFVSWLIFALIFGLTPASSVFFLPHHGLMTGLSFSLIAGLSRGGSAVTKHYALRLALVLNGYTPLRLIKFLDHCARLIFLKKVGGGYIFIHRMLLDYFAEMTPQELRTEQRGQSD